MDDEQRMNAPPSRPARMPNPARRESVAARGIWYQPPPSIDMSCRRVAQPVMRDSIKEKIR